MPNYDNDNCAQVKPQPEIDSQLESLSGSITDLEAFTASLIDQLAPVLTPLPTGERQKDSNPEPIRSRVATSLAMCVSRIGALTEKINRVRQNLEI